MYHSIKTTKNYQITIFIDFFIKNEKKTKACMCMIFSNIAFKRQIKPEENRTKQKSLNFRKLK